MVRFLVAAAFVTLTAVPGFGQTPKSAEENLALGRKLLASGNLAAARAPLESALAQATTDAVRLEINRTLLVPYRELEDVEPMQRAAEAVIANSPRVAERSLTRRSLLAFLHRRGKMDAAVTGYEDRLKTKPDDATVLYLLAEAYASYKKDPALSVAHSERLAAVEKKLGREPDPAGQILLAQQLAKAGKPKSAAEVYETAAPADKTTEAWHFAEAAAAWLKAGDKPKALAAARKSDAATPEKRSEGLTYFWHRNLADTYLDAGDPKAAVPHYESAIKSTKIAEQVKECEEKLAKAKGAGV